MTSTVLSIFMAGILPDSYLRSSAAIAVSALPLVDLHAGGFDHLGPLRGFGADQLAETLRLAADRLVAIGNHAAAHIGSADRLVELGIEPLDDLSGRPGRDQHAIPRRHVIAGHARLGDRRQVR